MVHFITPLAARKSVTDWDLTCSLLKHTLRSLENQTSGLFRSIVCCHDIPVFAKDLDERFKFVIHPFAPPDKALSINGRNNGAWDMMLKRDVALHHAQPSPEDFVMLLDADDLLHKDLVKEVEAVGLHDAITVDCGYEMCHRTRKVLRRENMVDKSTSTFLLKGRILKTPVTLDEDDLVSSLYHTVWHSNLYKYLEENNISYKRLGDPRMIYLVNTSLNISDVFRKSLIKKMKQDMKFIFGRQLTSEDAKAFGFSE